MKRLTLLFALVVALGAAGCGGGDDESATPDTVEGTPPAETSGGGAGGGEGEGDPAAGEAVFAEAGCGGCHVFGPAGSTGASGPNLDESDVDFEGAVEQIRNGGGGMPPFEGQLSDQQINDVAAFVTQG